MDYLIGNAQQPRLKALFLFRHAGEIYIAAAGLQERNGIELYRSTNSMLPEPKSYVPFYTQGTARLAGESVESITEKVVSGGEHDLVDMGSVVLFDEIMPRVTDAANEYILECVAALRKRLVF